MKLWGGRYEVDVDAGLHALNRSIPFDRRLWRVDLQGSIAWAEGLYRADLVDQEERARLIDGLTRISDDWERGAFEILPSDEDIHSANERRLTELIGAGVAGKLHTGRSRNDQVATDLRLYVRGALARLDGTVATLQHALLQAAAEGLDHLMPGYTHLQQAQPVRWSHWLLQFFWMLDRDRARIAGAAERTDDSPLGAGALAGHSLGVDRAYVADALGFSRVTPNSLDAVSDRDFVLETLAAAAILGTHLSRLAEDLILYASREFGFVRLDPRFTTGSSLMPQKANPDALELARGKSGRLTGNLVALLVTVKGLPSSYNKDLQEDKEPLFDSLDTLEALLPVLAALVETMRPQPERMRAALDDAMLATDLADALVRRQVPFREAHDLVGRAVAAAEQQGTSLAALSSAQYQEIDPRFPDEMTTLFSFERSVEARSSVGGTARGAVESQLAAARLRLEERG